MAEFIEAVPHNGYLVHASSAHRIYARGENPKSYQARRLGGRALCGVTGRDSWGYGGMVAKVDEEGNDVPFDPDEPAGNWDDGDKRVYSHRCDRCARKARQLRLSTSKGDQE